MTDSLIMTEADERALSKCPEGWFTKHDSALVFIKNPDYRCMRLVERGKLEDRVVGNFPHLQREYRKVEKQ